MTMFLIWLAAVPVVLAAVVLNGLAASVLWGWFAVPIFGVPPITIPEAIGLSMLIGMFVSQVRDQTDDNAEFWVRLAVCFARPAVAVGVGWIILQFTAAA